MGDATQLSAPFSTGGGGHNFENHVQAAFVVLMLAADTDAGNVQLAVGIGSKNHPAVGKNEQSGADGRGFEKETAAIKSVFLIAS